MDEVLIVLARMRRGKFEVPRASKFKLSRVADGWDKVRPMQKFQRFVQFPSWPGRVIQTNNKGEEAVS